MARKSFTAVLVMLIAGALFFSQPGYAEGGIKIGFVDLAKVFDQYGKTVDFDKSLEKKGKAKEEERRQMVEEIRKLQDETALLSEEARSAKQPIIDEKIRSLREFNRETQGELVKERNDKITEILADIQKIVEGYAKESDYDVVLNSRMLLYGNEQYDITDEVLKRLNK
ncbi:MAG: OmpH family outer membrane protein [Candidatus Omnitrophota bacterium]